MNKLPKNIIGEVFTSTNPEDLLHSLCLDFGPRLAGSEDLKKAADFAASKLREYGLDNVGVEKFPMAVWQRGKSELKLFEPFLKSHPCIALPYSTASNLKGELLDLGWCSEEIVQEKAEQLRGKIVLVDNGNPPGSPKLHRLHKYLMVKEAGASAFLFAHTVPGMLAPTGSLAFDPNQGLDQTIPSAGLSLETATEIREHLKRGAVTVQLDMENSLVNGSCQNVVATLPGATEETVLLVGHLDGHDISHGANDNASGSVAILEIARILKLLNRKTRCTLKIALFSGEELGLLGSHAYTKMHSDELEKIRMVFNLDIFGGQHGTLHMALHGTKDLENLIREICSTVPDKLAINTTIVPFSDHFPFYLKGINAAACHIPASSGGGWVHTAADTFDKVDLFALKRGIATLLPVLTSVLDLHEWPMPEIDVEKIKTELQQKGMDKLFKYLFGPE
ncbi:DUF4910 domain-containing protein [Planctomycetota bacterium]